MGNLINVGNMPLMWKTFSDEGDRQLDVRTAFACDGGGGGGVSWLM